MQSSRTVVDLHMTHHRVINGRCKQGTLEVDHDIQYRVLDRHMSCGAAVRQVIPHEILHNLL